MHVTVPCVRTISAEPEMTSQTLTVLFADLSGSTRLYQTHGDVKAHQSVSQSLLCMRTAIERHGGKVLRTVGDAVLASFEDTDAACASAVDIQREHASLELPVRVGFHYGRVIPDAGDVYGNAVNLASRIAEYAEANEICTTEEAVRRMSVKHRTNTHFLDKVQFKGVVKEQSVYRVNWRTDSAQTAIVTAVKGAHRRLSTRVLELCVSGRTFSINAGSPVLSFGRSDDNDVVLESESASRHHAAIELVKGRFMLSDFSTNGTYLLKESSALEFVRRESISLEQSGVLGFGFDPQDELRHAAEYRLVPDANGLAEASGQEEGDV